MEDGFPLFDPNNEAERQEQKLREYYESFSANARKRLLAKTVIRPTSVYDILYPRTRELLLAKNVIINNDLEESAKIIRDKLIAKIVTEETDLEKISADFRNSLLARAKIQEDRNKLIRNADAYRKNNLSKNTSKETDLEADSNFARTNNVSKNKLNPSIQGSIEKNSDAYKQNALSKNTSKDQDLLRDSDAFRQNDAHKNVPKKTDIESLSEAYRSDNLRKNNEGAKNLDEIASAQRGLQLSKNTNKISDIEEDSSVFRTGDLSKNSSKDQDLLRDTEDIRNQFRKNNVSKNTDVISNIENDSLAFRKNNESKNKLKTTDVESDSEAYRSNNLSNNRGSGLSIDDTAESKRADSISANKPNQSNLEQDSEIFRKDDLSLNSGVVSDLESDSAQFRADDMSVNKSNDSDLESDSAQFRADGLSANKPNGSDLESDSVVFRGDDLSLNKSNITDLESDSSIFRSDDLSANKSKTTNLESDSSIFRSDDLSANKPKTTNLESDSVAFRDDDLSLNKPKTTNLESDSIVFRDDDLSLNTPSESDLESDSVIFRDDDLSLNTPSVTDLEDDSIQFRVDDLAANTPNTSNLEVDSTPFLYNNISANVPSTGDLEVDSVPFRNDDLSANVLNTSDLFSDSAPFRNDDLAANVPNTSNLAVDSIPFRALGLAANFPINSNIAIDSTPFRDDLLASNTPYHTDLLTDSIAFRKKAVSKNEIFGLLGINIQGAGTSAFLGISRVFTQGILIRQLLKSKNRPRRTNLLADSYPFRVNNLARQVWTPQASNAGASLEYGSSNTHFDLLQGSRELSGSFPKRAGYNETGLPSQRAVAAQANYYDSLQTSLQFIYGNTPLNADGSSTVKTIALGDQAYYTDRTKPRGGGFDSPKNSAEATINYSDGYVTANMRLYNLERNSFNIKNIQVGGLDGFGNLQSFDGDEEFQALIASTIGSLNVRGSVSSQFGSNTTPLSVIIANGGKYFPGEGDLLRPGTDFELGTADSMMAKTAIGNPYEDEEFYRGKRGVRHIVNTIKSSSNPMAGNFNPQYNKTYVIGTNADGSERKSRQRYTIANPYAPGRAGKLLFSIKNYSSGAQFFFPPYIDSMQNTESASWNSVNFLGRPEAIYTYNNSSRDASISFFVLTDYSQNVDIGRDWKKDDTPIINTTFDRHFTDADVSQNNSRTLEQEKLRKLKKEQQDKSEELRKKEEELTSNSNDVTKGGNEVSSSAEVADKKAEDKSIESGKAGRKNGSTSDALKKEADTIKAEAAKTAKAIGQSIATSNTSTNYSETNKTAGNIYNLDITKIERNGDEIICKPEDTIVRINNMKSGLMFQPAFFSGDKIDFVRKIEFLSKLTRPSENNSNTGFSFTKPPISHIRLGDWWDHDIVVNSVSYDYSDAPWTLDGGRVQPMWVKVTLSFNIIGPYGSTSSRPPLSTDVGGMYS